MPNRPSTLICAAIGVLSLLAAMPARAAVEESTRIGGIDVVVWTPSVGGQRHLPVLLFSHALYLCPTQSRYLTRALADAGYLVVAPRHGDSSCSLSIEPGLSRWSAKPSPMWT